MGLIEPRVGCRPCCPFTLSYFHIGKFSRKGMVDRTGCINAKGYFTIAMK